MLGSAHNANRHSFVTDTDPQDDALHAPAYVRKIEHVRKKQGKQTSMGYLPREEPTSESVQF